ncbi:aldo/keto reductase [Ruminococcus sp. zg-924]|nr:MULTISPECIES: aldo/keto reductase [unclassified Ruminococcus]MCQ4022554.1 aldo/keto reductase [Ruminococcus sp. zg-924]MCQ4114794.1 aldo/keto reductase [Ruminococcus sp. zg-921]
MTFGESVFGDDVVQMIKTFIDYGFSELDTAYVYNEGQSEQLIGAALKELGSDNVKISTKVNPRITGKLDGAAAYAQLNESLSRLGVDCVDTFYLHFPDSKTPIESVLEACADLHQQGKFSELGLSNFPAWLVADVYHKCKSNGWVLPTVYEGIYNPLTRKAETELDDALNYFGIRFCAYNPMAGGLLTGRYSNFEDAPTDGRFTHRPNYQKRYWKESFFKAVNELKSVCENSDISIIEATYRWMAFHSMLKSERGDAIIIGASKLNHLKQNMETIKQGPLPDELVDAFKSAWKLCKADSPEYFRFYGDAMN